MISVGGAVGGAEGERALAGAAGGGAYGDFRMNSGNGDGRRGRRAAAGAAGGGAGGKNTIAPGGSGTKTVGLTKPIDEGQLPRQRRWQCAPCAALRAGEWDCLRKRERSTAREPHAVPVEGVAASSADAVARRVCNVELVAPRWQLKLPRRGALTGHELRRLQHLSLPR
jgi:hypothetical protein